MAENYKSVQLLRRKICNENESELHDAKSVWKSDSQFTDYMLDNFPTKFNHIKEIIQQNEGIYFLYFD